MSDIDSLLADLDERTIARKVQTPHDNARNRYHITSNTVEDFDEFAEVIGDYYSHHFNECVAQGARLSRTEARARAKELLERESRRGGGDLVGVYRDCTDGREGGLRAVLDKLAEAMKAEAVERYVREAFDRHVAPHDWTKKVAIIRQFIEKCARNLDSSIQRDQPERYARDYRELIRAHLNAMRQTSAVFRRL